MAKKNMKRPEVTHTQPKNEAAAVPEIQGKAKHGNEHINPIIAGTKAPNQKVFHSTPFQAKQNIEKPVSGIYPAIDTDLGRDNIENDISDADLQDL